MVARTDELRQRISELEASGEDFVPMSQVKDIMGAVKSMFEGNFEGQDLELFGELGDLAKYINEARKELRQFQPKNIADKDIPDASDQLDAIVAQTEQATGGIMDSCEQLQGIHQRVKDRLISHEPPLDEDVLVGVDDAMIEAENHITRIYESCNFQDLTGQRIMKIVNTLREIERQVLRMVVVFGMQNHELDEDERKGFEEDVNLLEGPQLPGNSLEQDDIDDILNKLL